MNKIATKAAEELGASVIDSHSVGDYQGMNYFLFSKDGKYSIVSYAYGSCAHCDWRQALESHWEQWNEYKWEDGYPIEVYREIIDSLKNEAKFMSKDELLAQFHMIFGVGFDDKEAEDYFRKELTK